MGLSFSPSKEYKNLYTFWSDRILEYLKNELAKNDVIINLASQEYSSVIDFKKISRRVITPYFKEFKNGKNTMVMMFAKNARGKMARFIIENEIENEAYLKSYNIDGYAFDESLSTSNDWVFVR
jgi:cytoplasmic iron level regulating protein YaaA (DUF328/UPF0246 family)